MDKQRKTNCLDCQKELELPEQAEIGDVLVCDECGVEMEIISVEPIELDYLMVEK